MLRSVGRVTTFKNVAIQKRPMSFWSFFNPNFDDYVLNYDLYSKTMDRDSFTPSVHSDKEYGGGSECQFSFLEDEDKALRFSGTFNFNETHIRKVKPGTRRGLKGFCAVNVKYNRIHNLREYEGLRFVARSPHKMKLTFNLECENYFDNGELYQVDMGFPGGNEWVSCFIPFNALIVTVGGIELTTQRKMDNPQVMSIGFLLKTPPEGTNGEFCVDFKEVTAVHEIPDERRQPRKDVDKVHIELEKVWMKRKRYLKDDLFNNESQSQQQQQQQQQTQTENTADNSTSNTSNDDQGKQTKSS